MTAGRFSPVKDLRLDSARDLFTGDLRHAAMQNEKRARSRSFTSHQNVNTKQDQKPATNTYDNGSSVLSSRYEVASSNEEINDSRFNDISCISFADRTMDEKDNLSRNDVSVLNSSRTSSNNVSNDTKNTANSFSSLDSSALDQSAGSKRKFGNSFNASHFSANSASSAKRLRKDIASCLTDSTKKCNPLPQAIPILHQRTNPPDRLNNLSSLASLANSSSCLNSSALNGQPFRNSTSFNDSGARNQASNANQLSCRRDAKQDSLDSLLSMAKQCAKIMNADCVSTSLSKSHNEQSLRFTC